MCKELPLLASFLAGSNSNGFSDDQYIAVDWLWLFMVISDVHISHIYCSMFASWLNVPQRWSKETSELVMLSGNHLANSEP